MLSCYLMRLVLKHSDTKLKKKKNHSHQNLEGARACCAPLWIRHWTWPSRGSYGVYVADTGSVWLLRCLRPALLYYVLLFVVVAKIALRGSYGTALRVGMTAAFN